MNGIQPKGRPEETIFGGMVSQLLRTFICSEEWENSEIFAVVKVEHQLGQKLNAN